MKMGLLSVSSVLLAVCGLALASYSHGGTSYSSVVKHDIPIHHSYGGHQQYGADDHYGSYIDHGHGYGYGHYDKHDYYKYPKYQFDYGVKDLKTGDIKNQWEHRDGDLVKGGYSLKESDGTTRVVEYSADDHNGFNAIVKKLGHAHHPQIYASKGHYGGYGYANALDHDSGSYAGGYGGDYGYGYGHGHASSYVNVKQL